MKTAKQTKSSRNAMKQFFMFSKEYDKKNKLGEYKKVRLRLHD